MDHAHRSEWYVAGHKSTAISLSLSRVKTEVKVFGLFIGCPAAEGGENEK